jgi:4-amino-4-deoxy-L-arabinose transferase-like glycosyltransferase
VRHVIARTLVGALCLFAFTMSITLNRAVFERLPHLEDEYAYLFQARMLARGDLVIETPPLRRALWQPFIIDHDGKLFSKYAPGWGLILAGGTIAGGEGREWIVNALLAAVTVALVYRIGYDLFDRRVGVIAAALVACSPMALLLNASFMGHTAALCAGAAALWTYIRLERGGGWGWAVACGLALGLLAANRPITAVAFGLPLAVRALTHMQMRLAWWVRRAALALVALTVALVIPVYNIAAVGRPNANLYTLVWEYDCVGFGTCGRPHTLEKAFRHTLFDLSLTAVDLFGFSIPFGVDDPTRVHLTTRSDAFPAIGLSALLIPVGLALALRRRIWMGLAWAAVIGAAGVFAVLHEDGRLLEDAAFGWGFVIGAIGVTVAPLVLLRRDARASWAWLVWMTAALLIVLQLAYWVGSQRYSTRYYYEGLAGAALLTAIPLARLAHGRRWVYPIIAGGLALSVVGYGVPRVDALRGYNRVTEAQLIEVNRRRGDQDALVIITGRDVRWRAYGALMAVTSPYRDSPIVAAWDYSGGNDPAVRAGLLAAFPDRVVIDMRGAVNEAAFADMPQQ